MGRSATETPAADDLRSHLGRPRSLGELDPELIVLPRRRVRIGPLLAAAIAVFCLYLMVRLAGDLTFALQDDSPAILSVTELSSAAANRFVEVAGVPDHASLYRITRSGMDDGLRAMPLLGSGGKAWVLLPGSPWADAAPSGEVYRGRVSRADALPFEDELAAAVERSLPILRPLAISAARAALGDQSPSVPTLDGDTIALTPESALEVVQTVADRALITAAKTDDHPDRERWRAALGHAGIPPLPSGREEASPTSWTFEIAAPGGADEIAARLVEARLFAARSDPLTLSYSTTWRELGGRGDELEVGDRGIPWSEVSGLAVSAAPHSPRGATFLISGESPESYWFLPPLFALLALSTALFGWALWLGLRPERPPVTGEATPAG